MDSCVSVSNKKDFVNLMFKDDDPDHYTEEDWRNQTLVIAFLTPFAKVTNAVEVRTVFILTLGQKSSAMKGAQKSQLP